MEIAELRRSCALAGLGFLMLVAGCGDDTPSTDVNLPRPDHGFQLVVPPFPVLPSSEVQDCYFFKAPIDAPMDVHRMVVALNPGSHHMNLFRFVGASSGHVDGEIQRGCWDAVAFESYDLVFNSQTEGQNDWTLPAGVSHHFEPGDMFMLQTHYVNATTQKTTLGRGKVMINFYESSPADAQNKLGSMFANNRGIVLQPNQESSFTTDCYVPEDVHFVAVAGHFHSRGVEFDIGVINDPTGTGYQEIYRSTSWDSPPWGTFDPGMACPAGGGLRYTCKFFNDTDQVITFGPHVEFQEHCNVFAYYYPALESRTSIYCF
jgi:hypothetical protein